MADILLVHGAMHGGWCWRSVEDRLRAAGHRTVAPTLTGCGDRAHLRSPEVGPATHVEDILATLFMEDMRSALLVAHSYAGVLLGSVVEQAEGRVGSVMAIGAFLVDPGEALTDVEPPSVVDRYRSLAADNEAGPYVPPTPAFLEQWAVPEVLRPWVGERLTGFPIRCVDEAIHFDPAPLANLPRHYVAHTAPALPSLAPSVQRARERGWEMHELATGHDVMLALPDDTASVIDAVA